jgi:hypothetical protein
LICSELLSNSFDGEIRSSSADSVLFIVIIV